MKQKMYFNSSDFPISIAVEKNCVSNLIFENISLLLNFYLPLFVYCAKHGALVIIIIPQKVIVSTKWKLLIPR